MDFSQLALLMVAAATSGVVAKLLKQPLIIGYLFAGFLLSFFGVLEDVHVYEGLGQVGVALLLFLVGVEMNIKDIKSIGKVAVSTGIGQILFTSFFGFLLSLSLGFSTLSSVYIAIALTFSSTIIIIKLLSEKGDLNSLYGKISVGFLLVQDLVAILILVALAGLQTGEVSLQSYVFVLLKALGLFAFIWFLSTKVLHFLYTKIFDSSSELLFIVTIAWALGLSAFVGGPLGLSLEIGGFLAGLALSSLPEHLQIASRTRPIRDFFLTIFFIILGTNLVVANIASILVPAIIFSLFVLIGNPIIVLVIMGVLGYKKKTSFSASFTVAQISEFSLILMSMGLVLSHISEREVATLVLVGVITMTLSTYMILNSEYIYLKIKNLLNIFERKNVVEEANLTENYFKDHVILVGADRTGEVLLPFLKKKFNLVVVDLNPEVVSRLTKKGTAAVFGDITDEEIQEAVSLKKAKTVISTTFSVADNTLLLRDLKLLKSKAKFISKARTFSDAFKLYEEGATYVLVPEVLAGEHIRHLVKTHGSGKRLEKSGKSHHKRLKKLFK